jgi:hypothetical protein
VSQVGQEFQVGKVGKKGQQEQAAQVGQVEWWVYCTVLYVNVWKGGPEGSGGVEK